MFLMIPQTYSLTQIDVVAQALSRIARLKQRDHNLQHPPWVLVLIRCPRNNTDLFHCSIPPTRLFFTWFTSLPFWFNILVSFSSCFDTMELARLSRLPIWIFPAKLSRLGTSLKVCLWFTSGAHDKYNLWLSCDLLVLNARGSDTVGKNHQDCHQKYSTA